MKSELLSQEKNIVTIKVTVDKADFSKQLKKTYHVVAQKVNIPGFRKGKVPYSVLEMRIGKENLMGEALEDMLPNVLDEVCDEYEIEPIATPELNIDTLKDGEDVVFTVKYEVEPEVTLPEMSEITVDLPVFDVTDEMVNDALASLKKRHSTYSPVDRPAQLGDKVRLAYSMKVKDEKGEDVVVHEPQIDTFELDNLAMRQEIVSALVGAKAGEKRNAEVKVADDYQDKSVAGKMAQYDLDIIEVQERINPEMNDEFFKKVSNSDIHTEEALRDEIRANLDKRLKADARSAAENDAIEKITKAAKVEVPESMIKRQRDHLRTRYEENIKQRTKMTLEEYYKSENRDIKELEENLDKDARRDVLGYLVIDACSKKFNVTVQKEDLDTEINQMAEAYGISSDSIKEMLNKRPSDFQNLFSSARYRKTVQAIMDSVKINEVKKGVDAQAPAAQN